MYYAGFLYFNTENLSLGTVIVQINLYKKKHFDKHFQKNSKFSRQNKNPFGNPDF